MDYFQIFLLLSIIITSAYIILELLFYCRWKYLEHYINTNVSVFDVDHSISESKCYHLVKMAEKYAWIYARLQSGNDSNQTKSALRMWIQFWFRESPFYKIYRQNGIEFLNWAFFVDADAENENERKWRTAFIDYILDLIEKTDQRKIPNGHNPNVSFVHNTSDQRPIRSTYRSIIFYIALYIGQKITDCVFWYVLKFEYVHINGLKVWYKLQSKYRSKPILLIHGLGVHYMPYIPLIRKIYQKSSENDTFCIEIPWTVMNIKHFIPSCVWKIFSKKPCPSYIHSKLPLSIDGFVEILQECEEMIGRHQTEKRNNVLEREWTFIGHSYGSFIVSGIYQRVKQRTGENIPRLILIDPVTLCLSHPTTVNFLDLPAKDWTCFILQQLAVRELMIACTLCKYMHWFEYALYPDDLMHDKVQHVVVSSCNDPIVPNTVIEHGILSLGEDGERKINHIKFENQMHASWMMKRDCLKQIVAEL